MCLQTKYTRNWWQWIQLCQRACYVYCFKSIHEICKLHIITMSIVKSKGNQSLEKANIKWVGTVHTWIRWSKSAALNKIRGCPPQTILQWQLLLVVSLLLRATWVDISQQATDFSSISDKYFNSEAGCELWTFRTLYSAILTDWLDLLPQ